MDLNANNNIIMSLSALPLLFVTCILSTCRGYKFPSGHTRNAFYFDPMNEPDCERSIYIANPAADIPQQFWPACGSSVSDGCPTIASAVARAKLGNVTANLCFILLAEERLSCRIEAGGWNIPIDIPGIRSVTLKSLSPQQQCDFAVVHGQIPNLPFFLAHNFPLLRLSVPTYLKDIIFDVESNHEFPILESTSHSLVMHRCKFVSRAAMYVSSRYAGEHSLQVTVFQCIFRQLAPYLAPSQNEISIISVQCGLTSSISIHESTFDHVQMSAIHILHSSEASGSPAAQQLAGNLTVAIVGNIFKGIRADGGRKIAYLGLNGNPLHEVSYRIWRNVFDGCQSSGLLTMAVTTSTELNFSASFQSNYFALRRRMNGLEVDYRP